MNAKEAMEIVEFWNAHAPKDLMEKEARWIMLNKALGFLQAVKEFTPIVLILCKILKNASSYGDHSQPIEEGFEAMERYYRDVLGAKE